MRALRSHPRVAPRRGARLAWPGGRRAAVVGRPPCTGAPTSPQRDAGAGTTPRWGGTPTRVARAGGRACALARPQALNRAASLPGLNVESRAPLTWRTAARRLVLSPGAARPCQHASSEPTRPPNATAPRRNRAHAPGEGTLQHLRPPYHASMHLPDARRDLRSRALGAARCRCAAATLPIGAWIGSGCPQAPHAESQTTSKSEP